MKKLYIFLTLAVGIVIMCIIVDRISVPQPGQIKPLVKQKPEIKKTTTDLTKDEVWPSDVILSASNMEVPGINQTPILTYSHPSATNVKVSGTWNRWSKKTPLKKEGLNWKLDVRPLNPLFGRNEFKFIVDEKWEDGANRSLYINRDGLIKRPADTIFSANMQSPNRIDVFLKPGVNPESKLEIKLVPPVPIAGFKWKPAKQSSRLMGFTLLGEHVTFRMDEKTYRLNLSSSDKVGVAGTFNGWRSDTWGGWLLSDPDNDGIWEKTFSLDTLTADGDDGIFFKFVVNGNQWLSAPFLAANAVKDGKGNTNLKLDSSLGKGGVLQIQTKKPLSLSVGYVVEIDGLSGGSVNRWVSPGDILDDMVSDKTMGVTLNKESNSTDFRVFAPRAIKVDLCFYDAPNFKLTVEGDPLKPKRSFPMLIDDDGVWEVSVPGLHAGQYYSYIVDGPKGSGEGFNPQARLGDPYARAVAHATNNAIVIDPDAVNKWFAGWTDQNYKAPKWEDVFIYETHVRDLTWKPSSGVPKELRGTFSGILESKGTGTGLDHLKKLGVNMIEFLPVPEFENGTFEHSWGYATAYFFAPDASYAQDPKKGSQYYEFKNMVNELHKQGFGVILDVVYNHIGYPNLFYGLDCKYYFRQDQNHNLSNFSGCGNDVKTEAPMMRKLIVENVLYWMREHHVDGFRFDLAELIDMDTLRMIEKEARALNPNVLLISEPWSFRGDHKQWLKGTGWAGWNDDYRNAIRGFILGHGNREEVMTAILGSVDSWCANPMQSVNYLESHDDMCLADELSSHPKKDARVMTEEDAARNRLGATILFTSLGIPMIAEGQEYLRSKRGIHNTFDKGDKINALEWNDRNKPFGREALNYYQGLSRLRQSPAGGSFRKPDRVHDKYYRWILPNERRALGYIVNQTPPGSSFIVLINASEADVTFSVRFPQRRWRMIADGRQVKENGIAGRPLPAADSTGLRRIKVSGLSSQIFMGK